MFQLPMNMVNLGGNLVNMDVSVFLMSNLDFSGMAESDARVNQLKDTATARK